MNLYTCPMHPEVVRGKPGNCPGCGMALIPSFAKATAGKPKKNNAHAEHMETDMRRRFWISLLLSIPITLYSPLGLNYFKLALPTPIPANWLLLILTTPVVFWTGSIFITGTYYSLKARKLNMSVLIATGVLAAYLFSVLLTIIILNSTFF